jgi:hypothetical protein
MGEMADYFIGLALDRGEGFAPRHRERRGYYGPKYSKPVECRYCHSQDVVWLQREDKSFQLKNKDGSVHNCRHPEQPTAEGFDDVD